MRADAVFEGGGAKGIGLVGAAQAIEERGYEWANLAGTSAGAMVASLLAAGYSARELHELFLDLDYTLFRDKDMMDRIPLAGPFLSFFLDLGLYEGQYALEWLRGHLEQKGVTTFGDLVDPEYADDHRFRYRLRVIASDITNGRLLVLPQDIRHYGVDPDRLSVALAVRMSISLPFFFEPVMINSLSGREAVVVDGGLLSNFPVWLFDVAGTPEWPTFGLKLAESTEPRPREIKGPLSMLVALFSTMLEAHDARAQADQDYVRTIHIPTLGVGTVQFDLTREQAEALFRSGYEAASRFLDDWNFDSYVNLYRVGDSRHGRRLSLQ